MEQARVHVFDDIPKELYDLRKEQIVKLNEVRQKGHTAYFSKAHPEKLFVNGKYIAPERPLEQLEKLDTIMYTFISFCNQ